ncbi:hypothetical protein [Streptomyces aurantiogriseus]
MRSSIAPLRPYLSRRLDAEPDVELARTMYFPVRWDPFFKDAMTLEDVYRYPTRHFDFHRAQLTLGTPSSWPEA